MTHTRKSSGLDKSPAIELAREFLTVVWDGPAPTVATLAASLDRLVAAYHDTPDSDVSGNRLEPPRQDGQSLYKQVAARLPDYGFYPVSDPTAAPENATTMGDAIDNLADLTLDMREVIRLADHVGVDDARWSYRLHFHHWGLHARELSL